jgi:hypothetical protein
MRCRAATVTARTIAAGALLSLALAATAASADLPSSGVLVPGRSLGGVRLGAIPAQVTAVWGQSHGVCRSCPFRTWYFNYRPFAPQGAGVELRHGRVAAAFTLWSPAGWRTSRNLVLGDDEARITALYGALLRTDCPGYRAFTLRTAHAVTALYVVGGKVWGFALLRPGMRVCR